MAAREEWRLAEAGALRGSRRGWRHGALRPSPHKTVPLAEAFIGPARMTAGCEGAPTNANTFVCSPAGDTGPSLRCRPRLRRSADLAFGKTWWPALDHTPPHTLRAMVCSS